MTTYTMDKEVERKVRVQSYLFTRIIGFKPKNNFISTYISTDFVSGVV